MRVKVSYIRWQRGDEYEDGTFVGVGSFEGPDSALVAVAGPVATPAAAICTVTVTVAA